MFSTINGVRVLNAHEMVRQIDIEGRRVSRSNTEPVNPLYLYCGLYLLNAYPAVGAVTIRGNTDSPSRMQAVIGLSRDSAGVVSGYVGAAAGMVTTANIAACVPSGYVRAAAGELSYGNPALIAYVNSLAPPVYLPPSADQCVVLRYSQQAYVYQQPPALDFQEGPGGRHLRATPQGAAALTWQRSSISFNNEHDTCVWMPFPMMAYLTQYASGGGATATANHVYYGAAMGEAVRYGAVRQRPAMPPRERPVDAPNGQMATTVNSGMWQLPEGAILAARAMGDLTAAVGGSVDGEGTYTPNPSSNAIRLQENGMLLCWDAGHWTVSRGGVVVLSGTAPTADAAAEMAALDIEDAGGA